MRLILLCLVGLLPRLWLAWQDMPFLVGKLTADDFYYYLTIARNLAAGRGATFDGLSATNGFHPLYTLALTPLLAVAGENRELGVHLALSLVALLDVLVAAALYGLAARRVSRPAGLAAALAWLANPWAMTTALHGVESAIYLLLVVITLAVYLLLAEEVWCGARVALAVGALAGLAVLGRTDGVFLLVAIVFDGVWRAWRGRAGWAGAARAVALIGVGFVAATGAWWLWNLLRFGTIMQVSGQALLLQWHGEDWLQAGAYAAGTLNALRRYGLRLLIFLAQVWPLVLLVVARRADLPSPPAPLPTAGEGGQSLPPAPLATTGERQALGGGLSPSPRRGEGWGEGRPSVDLFVPFAYAGLLLAWYAFYFWHLQNWYLMPVMLVGSLVIGYLYPALERALRRLTLHPLAAVSGYLLLSGVAIFTAVWLTRGFGYPRQVNGLRIAEWVNANAQPGERIGAWNAGVVGYFSRRPVVNLDAVTNNDLYHWVTERGLPLAPAAVIPYAAERGLTYVTDYEDILAPVLNTPVGARLSPEYRVPGSYVVIYRVLER